MVLSLRTVHTHTHVRSHKFTMAVLRACVRRQVTLYPEIIIPPSFFFQVHHTTSFPEFHVDWMSPEEVSLHRENASSQIYRGISASLGFKKPTGYRLFRGYKELCQHAGKRAPLSFANFFMAHAKLLLQNVCTAACPQNIVVLLLLLIVVVASVVLACSALLMLRRKKCGGGSGGRAEQK